MLIEYPLQERNNDVHLWITAPQDYTDTAALEVYESLLSVAERRHYAELAQPDHRREYLVGRAFVREILAGYTGQEPADITFTNNASGKPSLQLTEGGERLCFNFSHGADLMTCAVTRLAEVGVDVETVSEDRAMVEVADHYFSSIELAGLEAHGAVDQQEQFFRIWTLKEAYIKARGEGLNQALDSFSFYCPDPDTIRLVAQGEEVSGWSFWSLQPVAGQMIAVAVQSAGANLRVFSRNPQGIQQELRLSSLGQEVA
jgi:4'-phosphopantetheinyl transferase